MENHGSDSYQIHIRPNRIQIWMLPDPDPESGSVSAGSITRLRFKIQVPGSVQALPFSTLSDTFCNMKFVLIKKCLLDLTYCVNRGVSDLIGSVSLYLLSSLHCTEHKCIELSIYYIYCMYIFICINTAYK